MKKQFSAEFVLHALFVALLAMAAASTFVGYYVAQERLDLTWPLAGVLAVGVVVCWIFRVWIRSANVGPLRMATKLVERVAGGDLTANAEGMDFLHTRKIANALNTMTANLRSLVSEVAT